MTFGAPDSAATNSMRIPSIAILGADALLAAHPATPIQLAHACALAGYQHVIPASWGDELIAAASLRALRDRALLPAIQCSCPHVAHRLLAVGTDLRPFLVSLVAPPVVLARYLRTAYGQRKLRITYVGRCPGAADEAIDARLTPEELLAIFVDHHIVVDDQPQVFDSVIPPDRRRFRSQPGGLPTPEMLWSADGNGGVARSLVELHGDDLPVELAQHLLAGKPVLIDVAPKLGCVCSGATSAGDPSEARLRVTALEPPRASTPVIDESIAPDATLPLPASPRSAIDIVAPPVTGGALHVGGFASPNDARTDDGDEASGGRGSSEAAPASATHSTTIGRRPSPARGVARPVSGSLPTARDADGRQLPRTYVARRRVPPRPPRPAASDAERLIPSSTEEQPPLPNEPRQAAPPFTPSPITEPLDAAATVFAPAAAHASLAPSLATSVESAERVAPLRAPSTEPAIETPTTATRFSERAVALPVTPLSDARPRHEPPPNAAGERPVMQLLTLGLLIAMIVLVSAAVGVLVGRWMAQR